MSIRSRLFAMPMPGFLRRACIARLAELTAEAFGVNPPPACTLGCYASFTAEQAGRAPQGTADRLFSGARYLGARLRMRLGIRKIDEALAVMRALYRVIGVDFRGTSEGFVIARCSFSSTYSLQVCRLISSLDEGLIFGLTGGKRMSFTRRITEGAAFCGGVLA
ncbi:MAG TPA: hypothetical protein VMU36_10050 [Spirochaetia bacterium]|nr:hypothetical protein [Spirochaetia bacterium]